MPSFGLIEYTLLVVKLIVCNFISSDTLIWRELNTSGHLLPPRAGHATVAFGKNLFVFGGFTDAQNLYNDLYALDVGMYLLIMFACVMITQSFPP